MCAETANASKNSIVFFCKVQLINKCMHKNTSSVTVACHLRLSADVIPEAEMSYWSKVMKSVLRLVSSSKSTNAILFYLSIIGE